MLIAILSMNAISAIDDANLSEDDNQDNSNPINQDDSDILAEDGNSAGTNNESSVETESTTNNTDSTQNEAETTNNTDSTQNEAETTNNTDSTQTESTTNNTDSSEDNNAVQSAVDETANASSTSLSSPIKTKIKVINASVVKGRTLYVQLLDKDNKTIKNQKLTIILNNKKYTNTTNSLGKMALKLNLNIGKYSATVKYNGNENYSKSNKTFTLKIHLLKTSFTTNSSSIIRGNYFYAYLKDQNGDALASKKVTLKFNGKTYTKTTNSKGRISHKISTSSKGKYPLKLSFNGGTPYLKTSKTFTINAHNIKTKIVVLNYSVVRGKYLNVVLKDSGNRNLSKEKVTFTLSNKNTEKTTSDIGKASLRITKVPGTYTVKIKFAGDKGYLKSSRSIKVKVLRNTTAELFAKNQTKHLYGNDTVKYYIRLTDLNGNPIVGETVKLRVKNLNITKGSGNKITKKTIVLSSDNIINKTADKKLLNQMAKILREKGYTVIVSGVGPNYHVSDVAKYKNVCVFSLVGGVDSGMFVDMASNYYKNYLKYNKNQFVLGCVSPPIYLNLANMTWLIRAHDDDYSPKSFTGLYYPGKYLNTKTKVDYVYGDTADELVKNFLTYAKKGKSIGINSTLANAYTTYKLTTSKNGYVSLDLPVGTYTVTSSVLANSSYKVDAIQSKINIVP